MSQKITVNTTPHFVIKDTNSIEETKVKLFEEVYTFFQILLNASDSLVMEFMGEKSNEFNSDAVKINYYIDNPRLNLEYLTKSLNYFQFDISSALTTVNSYSSKVSILRQLKFVPVGDLNYRDIEPNIMPSKRNFDANKSFLIPITKSIRLLNNQYKWKYILSSLANLGGKLVITVKKITPSYFDSNYALQCLNYYQHNYENKILIEELNNNTNIYQKIVARQELFATQISINAHEETIKALQFAFLQDLDPNALNSEKITNNFQDKLEQVEKPIQDFIQSLQYYWTQDEIIEILLTPPYSFQHALAGIKHFVPTPFLIPVINHQPNSNNQAIMVGKLDNQQPIYLNPEKIRQHIFITGACGSGKTNTSHHLFYQLQQQTPILVIDPIKREYEEVMIKLGKQDHIIDFKDGNYPRFNPFIPPANITIYAHSSVLAKTLALLCPTNEVAYEIIVNMVRITYRATINRFLRKNNQPQLGFAEDLAKLLKIKGKYLHDNPAAIPTFKDFLEIGMKWLRANINPQTRWGSEAIQYFERRWKLLEMSLFAEMFNNNQSIDKYFKSHYLIELYNVLDQNESNALFAIFIALLYEYRLSEGLQNKLQHITIIEEAHRIIPAQQRGLGENQVTSAAHEASQLLAQMLAEVRAYGEGIIVIDQSPSKILPDVLINCLTKIVHRVSYGVDKECLSQALNLSNQESSYLSYLETGFAIASLADTYQPVHLNIPKV